MKPNIAFVGLGVMGQRMLTNMRTHGSFTLGAAWDPDPEARGQTQKEFPEIRLGASADDIIGDAATDVVYVACPPASHRAYVLAALDAGKPVFCEKPLGVDVAESRDMVDRIEQSGLMNAVNFSFASAAASDMIKAELEAGALGRVMGADLRLHFSQWPRDWQVHASDWLSLRAEGGFAREVVSHYAFLTERLFGKAHVTGATLHYPDGPEGRRAETHLSALLDCSGVPVSIAGSVGGVGPDRVEYTVWGENRSYRLYDWNRLRSSDGGDWREELTHMEDPRQEGYMRMLDNILAQLAGRPHTMASFREALSVQELVERLLEA
ncbi:MAG: Gfo/Idh/MocA family protein [Methyloligellaceae bacterium]